MTRTDGAPPTARRFGAGMLALSLSLAMGCSGEAMPPDRDAGAASASPAAVTPAAPSPASASPAAAATATVEPGEATESKILGEEDITLRGKPACKIGFAYAGYEPDGVIWEEKCADVSADLVDRAFLQKYNKWERLDEFDRKFIQELPGGKVAYVEGSFTASIYPVGTDRKSYEVSVAD